MSEEQNKEVTADAAPAPVETPAAAPAAPATQAAAKVTRRRTPSVDKVAAEHQKVLAEALTKDGFNVSRGQVTLNTPIKTLGLHTVPVVLHPEVSVTVTVNVARSAEEAERQAAGENVTARDYPAILAMTSLNDTRVYYVEPAKWVAALRSTKTDDHPVLLKTEMVAGHGGVSGRYKAWRERAFQLAWLLDQVGVTA